MHISVIGTGYVGLVTGACFSEFGVNVTCMDTDAKRIARLEKGDIPFYEPGITELVAKGIRENRISFTTDVAKAVDKALVIFIAVGTPPRPDGSADLSYVEEVGRGIARTMTGYKVIVTKSTVPVGTGEKLREVINANQSGKFRFDIVSNPEFLREGSAIEDFMRPNRVVIGADSEQAIAIMKDLYRPLYLIETPFVVTDIPTAEMIKYASNAFLATKISFINEIATVCERVGADVQMVAKGMGLDNRIGSKFLHAGPGFGGSCFPKDLAAIVQTGEWPEGLRVQGWIRSKGCWMKDEGSGPSIKSMVIGKETKAYLVTFEHPGDPQGIGLMQKEVEADEVRYSVPGSRMVEFSLGGRVVYAANLDRVISISLVKEG